MRASAPKSVPPPVLLVHKRGSVWGLGYKDGVACGVCEHEDPTASDREGAKTLITHTLCQRELRSQLKDEKAPKPRGSSHGSLRVIALPFRAPFQS